MCSAKFPPFTVKASAKTACHKIQWLQFVGRNIAGLQSGHSRRHIQIPITLANLTLQLWLGINCNFGLASTTIRERGFPKYNWVKSDRRTRLKLETLDALMWVSLCGLPMRKMDWTKNSNTWKSTKNLKALPLELDDDEIHYVGNLNNISTSFYCMYFFNIVRHHIIFIFNTKRPISSCFLCEVLQKNLKVWVKCDYLKPFTPKRMCTLQTWTPV